MRTEQELRTLQTKTKEYVAAVQERHRTALLTAFYAASVFLKAADAEAQGGPSLPRQEAQVALEAALRQLEPDTFNPDINRSSIEPYPPDYRLQDDLEGRN